MRIAVIMGVSEYAPRAMSLPAAALDAAAMKKLLEATEEYESVLYLVGKLEAEPTKRRLMNFLERFEEPTVDEILFYYSGHGVPVPSGLAFAMSDFNAQHVVRGSIENKELDSYLRAIDPKVAVKILDCCYSGLRYIKGPTEASLNLNASEKGFDGCYFFSSSRHDQESWTGPDESSLSVFTQYFLDAVAEQQDGPVRYKQIADSISDRFLKEQQEPQFNIQGNMRHVFCAISDKVRLAASATSAAEQARSGETEFERETAINDIVAVVKRREGAVIPQEEAEQTLTSLRTEIDRLTADSRLDMLYEEKVWFPDSMDLEDDVVCDVEIGRWLKQGGRNFFGWPLETDPSRRQISVASMLSGYPERPRVTGFMSSAAVDYDRFFIRHIPRFEGLLHWEMATVILWSPWNAAVFSYGVPLKSHSWDRHDQPDEAPYDRELFSRSRLGQLTDYVLSIVERHRESIKRYVRRYTGTDT